MEAPALYERQIHIGNTQGVVPRRGRLIETTWIHIESLDSALSGVHTTTYGIVRRRGQQHHRAEGTESSHGAD